MLEINSYRQEMILHGLKRLRKLWSDEGHTKTLGYKNLNELITDFEAEMDMNVEEKILAGVQ